MAPPVVAVAGLDLAAGRGTSELAILQLTAGDTRPTFDLAKHLSVQSDDDILQVLAAVRPAILAIDAPLSLPAPVAAALSPSGPPGNVGGSPYTRAAERDPLWSRLGLRPLPVSFLGGLTFRAIALLPRLRGLVPDAAVIEVFPTATLRILRITPPTRGRPRSGKASPAARAAAQRTLATYISGVPDPADTLLAPDLLDALAAALTAALHLRRATLAVGDSAEGQIVLPDPASIG